MSDSYSNTGDFRGATLFQGSTIHYHGITATEVAAPDLRAAEALFARLPVDSVPAPAALPARSWMPLPRIPLFVGRADDLCAVARIIKAGEVGAVGQIAAALGLGGIGKTQLAAEFVHRYGQFFAAGVCWLSFAEPANVPGEVARCGGANGLALGGTFEKLKQPEQIARVLAAWCSPLPRLLVFDNCEDLALLQQWRPPHGASRVLLTSRAAVWPRSLGVQGIALGTLAPAESLALLRKHRPDLPEGDPALAAIAETLGHLPLALHLAGSYLERYRDDPPGRPATYLAALRDPDLLRHASLITGDPAPTRHALHVGNIFALSWEKLAAACAGAHGASPGGLFRPRRADPARPAARHALPR
jgi:hypothetical protein